MKKQTKKKKEIVAEEKVPVVDTPETAKTPTKEEVKDLASKDVSALINSINLLFKGYHEGESILVPKQKELVLRRVLSYFIANTQFNGARVSIHISDEIDYSWVQTQ